MVSIFGSMKRSDFCSLVMGVFGTIVVVNVVKNSGSIVVISLVVVLVCCWEVFMPAIFSMVMMLISILVAWVFLVAFM